MAMVIVRATLAVLADVQVIAAHLLNHLLIQVDSLITSLIVMVVTAGVVVAVVVISAFGHIGSY